MTHWQWQGRCFCAAAAVRIDAKLMQLWFWSQQAPRPIPTPPVLPQTQKYDHLMAANERAGSFYLQSKVYRCASAGARLAAPAAAFCLSSAAAQMPLDGARRGCCLLLPELAMALRVPPPALLRLYGFQQQ